MRLVLEWASEHRDELMEEWSVCSQLKYPKPIDPEVELTIRHGVPWRVAAVSAWPDFHLQVTFVDGTSGEVDLRTFLNHSSTTGTMFEMLRDPAISAQVQVVMGAVQWINGADLAPDAMYDAIKAHGRWVVE